MQRVSPMSPFMARQGDILIVAVAGPVPVGAKRLPHERGSVVLAHGEATNHCHRITSPYATLYAHLDDRYLVVEQPVELIHEEHGAIAFRPGTYRIVRQREYIPRSTPGWVDD